MPSIKRRGCLLLSRCNLGAMTVVVLNVMTVAASITVIVVPESAETGYRRHSDGFWYPLSAFGAGAIIGGAIANQPGRSQATSSSHVQWYSNSATRLTPAGPTTAAGKPVSDGGVFRLNGLRLSSSLSGHRFVSSKRRRERLHKRKLFRSRGVPKFASHQELNLADA